jgi:hypothetical protein
VAETFNGTATPVTMNPGDNGKFLTVWMGTSYWSNGNTYQIELYDTNGQAVGSTQKNAPGT